MSKLTTESILGPEGRIAAHIANYEHRPEQLAMAAQVSDVIDKRRHLVVEAGTGVGKSFAYLVPAILAATEDRPDDKRPIKRIVISTHTISLQEQLLDKDLPLLNSVIPREFSAVLVKGRSNYLSRRRLDHALTRSSSLFHSDEQHDQLHKLRQWTKETNDGSLSGLDFRPMPSVWDEVASDSSNCMGRNCESHKDCFYFRARRRAQHAQILVVNHALFFSDLALRRLDVNILPDYDVVIFDEAHTLEQVAGSHLGIGVSSGQVDYALNKLYNDRTNKGLLVHHSMGKAQQDVIRCRSEAEMFFGDLAEWLDERPTHNGRVTSPEIVNNGLSESIAILASRLKYDGRNLKQESDRHDFISAAERLTILGDEINAWNNQHQPETVYWLGSSQTRRNHRRITLSAAPIDVGPAIREHLLDKVPCAIFTSATLSTGKPGSFDFFRSRLGITQTESLKVGSPFNYQEQAKLVLVSGMPDPGAERQKYQQQCEAMIRRYVERSDGHAFVLFTSYEMMRQTASRVAPWLRKQNMALFCQADGMPRHEMLERFKANPRSVLFGTDSFWQGVDVPGDALTNVIITKLPFSVPGQPLLEARLEAIRKNGGNPFRDHQLPEAVLKLRQGFGRLIRSKKDHGIVVILDPRIRTKPYGRVFLESLPDLPIVDENVAKSETISRERPDDSHLDLPF